MPKRVACLIVLFLFLFLHPPVFAASVTLSNAPTNLNEEQEFTVTVNVSGAAAGTTNYLRAAFYSETSPTSYFGYTFNHLGNWYNGSPSPIDPHLFLEIQIGSDGTWIGDLKSKADITSSAFNGSGNYYFKVGRYTASGSSVSDWSGASTLSISAPTPSPTPSPTPTPASSTSQSTTSTKSPTPTPKPSATPAKSTSPSPSASNSVLGSKTEEQLLSTSTPEASPGQSAEGEEQKGSSKTKIAAMLTGSGVILIGLSIGFFVLYNKTLNKEDNKEEGKDIN